MVRRMRVDSGLPPFLWGGAHDGRVVHLQSDRELVTRSTPTIQLKGGAQGKYGGGRGQGESKEGEGIDQPNQREHPVVAHPKGQDESSQTSCRVREAYAGDETRVQSKLLRTLHVRPPGTKL